MEVSEETLRSSFRAMSDDELLRRWKGELTDEARLVARTEIDSRGLDASDQAFERLIAQDHEDSLAVKRRQRATISRMLIRLVLGIIAVAGAAVAALIIGVGR